MMSRSSLIAKTRRTADGMSEESIEGVACCKGEKVEGKERGLWGLDRTAGEADDTRWSLTHGLLSMCIVEFDPLLADAPDKQTCT
jgi:hypothetical protein